MTKKQEVSICFRDYNNSHDPAGENKPLQCQTTPTVCFCPSVGYRLNSESASVTGDLVQNKRGRHVLFTVPAC